MSQDTQKPIRIAIIGMACRFPKAPDLDTYWNNILDKVDAVGHPMPAWEAERYLSAQREKNLRITTAAGGFLNELYRFDPTEFGIMPSSLDGGEPDQYLALRVAAEALGDGGYLDPAHDHQKTGIILGHSTYLHRGQGAILQRSLVMDQTLELLGALFPDATDEKLAQVRDLLAKHLPPSNSDTAPGLVPNVMTGRIANRLNLMGPNYLLDAACASSLLSVGAAVEELVDGRADLMLAGGVNASLPAEVSVIFTQLGALSETGKIRPFDAAANGTLLGEGLGVVLLKRYADAVRDGDRIYSVIRGVGSSSDGKGQGLLAPRLEGEILAMRRAFERSGITAESIGLVEAHGTGIPLGDKTEITALGEILGGPRSGIPQVAIGSVKSMISHCIPAAGMAGLIKTSLALHHKVFPPTLCDTVSEELPLGETPLYVNNQTRPWIQRPAQPRRAAVNSFGFGGINVQALVEEAPQPATRAARRWAYELVMFAGDSRAQLIEQLDSLQAYLQRVPDCRLGDIAFTQVSQGLAGEHRLAIVAEDVATLGKRLTAARKKLAGDKDHWSTRSGMVYRATAENGKLVLLFPGEGSQYQQMLAELAIDFPPVREWFDLWQGLYEDKRPVRPSEVLYPPPTLLDEAQRQRLAELIYGMDFGSEAVFMASLALFSTLQAFGVEADAMVGHSTGENAALAASGAMRYASREELGRAILDLNRVYEDYLASGHIPTGVLLTVGALDRDQVEAVVAQAGGEIFIAMDNCANQLVLFGQEEAIQTAAAALEAAGGLVSRLPFDRAYHTPLFAKVSEAFEDFYQRCNLSLPKTRLYSCASAAPFPRKKADVQQLAASQWSRTVRFTETVERLHDDGYRLFLEVGPSGNLTAFVEDILKGRDFEAVASNQRARDERLQLLFALGTLFAHRHDWQLDRLFTGRQCQLVDYAGTPLPQPGRDMPLANTMPIIHLDEQAQQQLRDLLLPSAAPVVQPAMAPPLEQSDDDAAVMGHHFSLMQHFLDDQHTVLNQFLGTEASVAAGADSLPFIDEVIEQTEQRAVAVCHLNLEQDRFLQHHILSGEVGTPESGLRGLSVVPFTVTLEMMAEAAALLSQAPLLNAIESVTAYNWLALDEGALTVTLQAERMAGDTERFRVQVLQAGAPSVEGEFIFGAAPLAAIQPVETLSAPHASRWQDEDLYTLGMFHGPLFQSVAHIRAVSGNDIDADLNSASLEGFFNAGETPAFLFNPVLLDAVGQVSAYGLSEAYGTDFNCFPSRVERIEFVDPLPTPASGMVMRGRSRQADAGQRLFRWDYDCLDQGGRPIVRIHGWQDRFFAVPHRYFLARRRPVEGWLGEPVVPGLDLAGRDIDLWHVPPLPQGFLDDSGGIFKRILAQSQLGWDERGQWAALPPNPLRQNDWLMGRIAVKEAIRARLLAQEGVHGFATDVGVFNDEAGKPYVNSGIVSHAVEISLAHSQGEAIAAVAWDGEPVGVDMEMLTTQSPGPDLETAFTDEEQAILSAFTGAQRQELSLRLWCAKEAAGKYLGTGLHGQPQSFRVMLEGFVAERPETFWIEHSNRRIFVSTARLGDLVIALATRDQ